MTWSNFFVTIFVIYFVYYAVNVVMDLMGGGKSAEKEDLETLSFSDDYTPKKVQFDELEDSKTTKNNIDFEELKSIDVPVEKENFEQEEIKERKEVKNKKTDAGISGGVTINELINLAKMEAIVKSKSIAFA